MRLITAVCSSLSADWAPPLCARFHEIKMRCKDSGHHSKSQEIVTHSETTHQLLVITVEVLHPHQYCILILFLFFLICQISLFPVVDCNSASPLLSFLLFFFFYNPLPFGWPAAIFKGKPLPGSLIEGSEYFFFLLCLSHILFPSFSLPLSQLSLLTCFHLSRPSSCFAL